MGLDEDATDDEALDDVPDADEVEELTRQALAAEEEADIQQLLGRIGRLPPDSKLHSLKDTLYELRQDGYRQTMVFTQYTDTMDFLREELLKNADLRLMCFSGRGGKSPPPTVAGAGSTVTRPNGGSAPVRPTSCCVRTPPPKA